MSYTGVIGCSSPSDACVGNRYRRITIDGEQALRRAGIRRPCVLKQSETYNKHTEPNTLEIYRLEGILRNVMSGSPDWWELVVRELLKHNQLRLFM